MPMTPAQPRPPMASAPPERHRPPPVVVEQRAPHGPLDLQPAYEPTTTTMLQARRSTRNFVIILVVAAVLAIAIGSVVGYLIVGDDPAVPTKKP